MRPVSFFVPALAVVFAVARPGVPAELTQLAHPSVRVTAAVDDRQLKVLHGNTHPLADARFDQGTAPSDLPMNRMLLVLTRSTQQESALQALLAAQQDKNSPLYHHWLTPQEFGQQFGAADQDVQTVTAWLESYGFQVNRISNGRNVIEFSGTAGQVQQAFHTEIHKYIVNGEEHWANTNDPEVPAALGPVLAGIVTLHNFSKKPQLTATAKRIEAIYQPGVQPQFTASDGTHELVPADYATIYNVNPLYSAGINGSGTTVAVVARTDIKMSDVNQFRSTFGLSSNPPQSVVNGTDPGDLGGSEEAEAVLDTTWAGAVATGATIKLVVSKSTNSTDGVDLSEEYIIDNNLGDVMTESFGDCEHNYTTAEGAFYLSLAEQAASEGITYTVAAGDSGAEGCDDPNSASATGPISPNVLASTPHDIAVGGTQFNEGGNAALYWNATNNAATRQSARSYIPEITWNESCTTGTCTNGNTPGLWAGGGGASTFYSKPSWQSGVSGIPADGVRDTPDVSLTAAGHDAYLLCLDSSCTPDSRGRIYFDGYSGTSAATPSFAGIMALVVQKYGRQGQANYVLYPLAASENLSQCNASSQSGLPASTCIFNDVTSGNNAVPGEAGYGTATAAYQATFGYDLATGLGSVNVTNLVNQWKSGLLPSGVQVNVDNPGSGNSVVAGNITFLGWALYDLAPISSISIAIDNVPVGTTTLQLSRTDVCQAFPSGVDCPKVGWSFNFDTTTLPNGPHTVEATAIASDGQARTASSSFMVANWSTANPMHAIIDTPGGSISSFSGTAGFSGWALDDLAPIGSVLVFIDGVPYGTAAYGGNRPDVCNAFPNRPGCPNVGWTFTLDTTLLADGQHALAITPVTWFGQSATWTAPFTVNNSSANPFQLHMDQPNSQSGAFSGPARFSGWAVSSLGQVTSVVVAIDGVSYGNATPANRPDVCTALPGRAGCPNVGWTYVLDTTQLANGNHSFSITAYLSSGQHATISSSFAVSNVTIGLPIKMIIDNPNGQNSVLFGSATFSGWAIDDNGLITSVQVSIDGASRRNANYGSPRPDVCVAYPNRPGCPDGYVGWSYLIDTTLIPDGPHTVDVTASSSTGDTLTLSAPITVANWTAGNPMKLKIDDPATNAGPLSGTNAIVDGWAISDIASIASVTISVDGRPMGNASYGIARQDVCGAYPGRAGCPNVGWSFPLNTTQLVDGTHTLEVTARSSGGQSTTISSGFTVSNAVGNPTIIVIDQPTANSTLTDAEPISGWAINTNSGVSIAGVQILVDGVSYGSATSVYRPDVCAAYVNAGGCPNVGWAFSLHTSLLANGSHTLEVRTTASNGQQRTIGRPINVLNFR
ncbi:MAG TPA: protease pro-enzyme activation domain-containing protein [Bryobacteraceae bacterium]|nr:protease pro-enzyme activation domain-containing protein [Bryobacteraceae bacterium]